MTQLSLNNMQVKFKVDGPIDGYDALQLVAPGASMIWEDHNTTVGTLRTGYAQYMLDDQRFYVEYKILRPSTIPGILRKPWRVAAQMWSWKDKYVQDTLKEWSWKWVWVWLPDNSTVWTKFDIEFTPNVRWWIMPQGRNYPVDGERIVKPSELVHLGNGKYRLK